MTESDNSAAVAFARERARLRAFIRHRVPDPADVDDVLQDVFTELVEAEAFAAPIEQAGAWLFRVARNRIADLFRRRATRNAGFAQPAPASDAAGELDEDGEPLELSVLLGAFAETGPEADYAREVLIEALADALEELPTEQRDVFVAHEIEGRSFKTLAAQTGVAVNTLLSRKRYAVLHLRERLKEIHDEFVVAPDWRREDR